MQDLLIYWSKSPPVHELLAARWIKGYADSRGASAPRPQDEGAQTVSQIPQIASVLGVPVKKMSEKTRQLFEYAQSVLKSDARAAQGPEPGPVLLK